MKCQTGFAPGSRLKIKIRLIVAGLMLILVFPSFAQTGSSRRLPLDQWITGSVPIGDDWQLVTYRFLIRDDVFSLDIKLEESEADLDLFLYDDMGELIAFSELTDFNETLYLSRVTDAPLVSGQLTLEVIYPFERPPRVGGTQLDRVPFRVRASTVKLEPLATLRPGREVTGRLLPENGMTALYSIEVPRGTQSLRLDISGTDADADLFLFYGDVLPDLFDAEHIAQTLRSSESLVVERDSSPGLRTGTYSLLVIDQVTRVQEAEFTLTVSSSAEPPERLRGAPALPESSSPLERAILSTVEVLAGSGAGGSGSILSPSGLVLTNWHVVKGSDGEPDSDLTIGVSLDPRLPPVELFTARVIEYSEQRDLALLQIIGDRYGGPLPRGYEFPHVVLRQTEVSIAEELQFLGYPGVGGTGSRASITYTTGVVSGFQRTAFGYEIKTDGEINSGSSGGAALDGEFRLVGVPTSIVGEDSGQIAYVVPVTAIPAPWHIHLQ